MVDFSFSTDISFDATAHESEHFSGKWALQWKERFFCEPGEDSSLSTTYRWLALERTDANAVFQEEGDYESC
jgi:hypothetical protein